MKRSQAQRVADLILLGIYAISFAWTLLYFPPGPAL